MNPLTYLLALAHGNPFALALGIVLAGIIIAGAITEYFERRAR